MSTRFARVVEKVEFIDFDGLHAVLSTDALKLLHREHAAVVKKVKAMRKDGAEFGSENYGCNKACADLLAWLDGRGR